MSIEMEPLTAYGESSSRTFCQREEQSPSPIPFRNRRSPFSSKKQLHQQWRSWLRLLALMIACPLVVWMAVVSLNWLKAVSARLDNVEVNSESVTPTSQRLFCETHDIDFFRNHNLTLVNESARKFPISLGNCASYKPGSEADEEAMVEFVHTVQYPPPHHQRPHRRTSFRRTQEDRKISSMMAGFEQIEFFVMFFGVPQSGHSWIGSVLDAAPNAIIANEWDVASHIVKVQKKRTLDLTTEELYRKLAQNSFLCRRYGRIQAYNYSMPSLFQGKVMNDYKVPVTVIGDKKGGKSTKLFLVLESGRSMHGWTRKLHAKIKNCFARF